MADDDLKIFISWSGDLAKSIARVWHDLLLEMFDRATPWVSDLDIEAGARPLDDIKRELDGTSFGIIVVTPENQNAPWLNFEAGALSKALSDATTRVMPSLVNFTSPSQVTSPLKQFQGNLLNQEGVMKILKTIAKGVDADWSTKERTFNRAWSPEYEQRFNDCIANALNPAKPSTRTSEEMLDEVLTIVREIQRDIPPKTANGPRFANGEWVIGPRTKGGADSYILGVLNDSGIKPTQMMWLGMVDGLDTYEVGMSDTYNRKHRRILDDLVARLRKEGLNISYHFLPTQSEDATHSK